MPINPIGAVVNCVGCGLRILDKYMLNIGDRSWHIDCMRCAVCGCLLNERCFQRDDKLFCDLDFFKNYGVRCIGCNEVLLPQDLVRRVKDKHFHLQCLQCTCCRKQLSTGDELYVVDECKFVCKSDYISIIKKSNGELTLTHSESIDAERPDACYADSERDAAVCVSEAVVESAKMTRRNAKRLMSTDAIESDCEDSDHDNDHLDTESNVSANSISEVLLDGKNADKDSSASNSGPNNTNSPNSPANNNNNNNPNNANTNAAGTKRRGPRTTIKAKQLETLKNAFSSTPKPSRHIREQLASETGLNMRVIQVWFQNRRSKERRMKQLSAMGLNRRMLFNRGPRRLRALRAGLDPSDPMMAMLAENGASVAPNIDVSHHLSSIPANQSAVRPYDYFAAASEHAMPHPEYLLGLPHGHAMQHPAQPFAEYYPSAACNPQVFMETAGLKPEVFNQ